MIVTLHKPALHKVKVGNNAPYESVSPLFQAQKGRKIAAPVHEMLIRSMFTVHDLPLFPGPRVSRSRPQPHSCLPALLDNYSFIPGSGVVSSPVALLSHQPTSASPMSIVPRARSHDRTESFTCPSPAGKWVL